MRLNDLNQSNGVIRGWIDDQLAFEKTDIRFRTEESIKIEQIWLNIYHGGSVPSPHDQHCYLDNIIIAEKYIGPITD